VEVYVNGQPEAINPGETVKDFVVRKGLFEEKVVVEYNGRILDGKEMEKQFLEEGAVVEIVHFVGGG